MKTRQHFVLILRDTSMLLYAPGFECLEDDHERLTEALSHDPARPVTILLDFLDQQFEQVVLSGGSLFDRRKIIGRKVRSAFGASVAHGVVKLDRRRFVLTGSQSAEGRLGEALAMLAGTGNPVSRITLLPNELGHWLKAEFSEPDHTQWCLATLQSPLLGFRQIVLSAGQVVFSRGLQQVQSPEAVARETQSAFAYLSRLGLQRKERVTIISSLDEAPVSETSFAGHRVTGLHFLPAIEDYAIDFARWASFRRRSTLSIRPPVLTLARASRACLRASFIAAGLIALGGFGWLTHQHRQSIALGIAIAENNSEQQRLISEIAADEAPGTPHSAMRIVLSAADHFINPGLLTEAMPKIATAISPSIRLSRFQFDRDPAIIRLFPESDAAGLKKSLQASLPGHAIDLADDGVTIK